MTTLLVKCRIPPAEGTGNYLDVIILPRKDDPEADVLKYAPTLKSS
jgi:hypothetical protein